MRPLLLHDLIPIAIVLPLLLLVFLLVLLILGRFRLLLEAGLLVAHCGGWVGSSGF